MWLKSFLFIVLVHLGYHLQGQSFSSQGHSHNDYAHDRPLLDAIAAGMTSIEIDIFLIKGQLIVGHDEEDLLMQNDLESLYFKPMKKITEKNGGLYDGVIQTQILIDLKIGGFEILDSLHSLAARYSSLFDQKGVSEEWSPLQIVLSGDEIRKEALSVQHYPFFHVDGRWDDIKEKLSSDTMPLISDKYTKYFKWNGEGLPTKKEERRLKRMVRKVHKQGKKLRFWATPDTEAMWSHLLKNEVDYINVDDLEGFKSFMEAQ